MIIQPFLALPVLYRAHPTKRPFDTLVVIPVDVFFDKGEHLAAVALLLMLGVEGLDLYTPKKPSAALTSILLASSALGLNPVSFVK